MASEEFFIDGIDSTEVVHAFKEDLDASVRSLDHIEGPEDINETHRGLDDLTQLTSSSLDNSFHILQRQLRLWHNST